MSALAQKMLEEGANVSGSDLTETAVTKKLRCLGADVRIGHAAGNLPPNTDLCVYTSAVRPDNPELELAQRLGIKTLRREQLLGKVFSRYKTRVAVSGAHGKTTTTALITAALAFCGKAPTAFVGAMTAGGNYISGGGKVCVVEACEYKRGFLSLSPTVAVLLNIDLDHLDYYKELRDIENAFNSFTKRVHEQGAIIYNGDEIAEFILRGSKARRISFGTGKNNYFQAVNLRHKSGKYTFDVLREGNFLTTVGLNIRGRHNVYNALAAVAVCDFLGCEPKQYARALSEFCNAERRWMLIENDFTNIVEDYAHHPREIRALVETAKQQGYGKVYAVFQPHTYSRTQRLMADFAACFNGVNKLFLLPVYAAREEPIAGADSQTLADIICDIGVLDTEFVESFERAVTQLRNTCTKDDLLLIVGAGDINRLSKMLEGKSKEE